MFCINCGLQLSEKANFCAGCGTPAMDVAANIPEDAFIATIPAAAPAPTRDEERTILQRGEIVVTTKRLVVPGQTFALSQVTSVSTNSKSHASDGQIFAVLVGVVGISFLGAATIMDNGTVPGVIGVLVVLGAIVMAGTNPSRDKYSVVVHNSGGEVRAFESYEKGAVSEIVDAVNEAIQRA